MLGDVTERRRGRGISGAKGGTSSKEEAICHIKWSYQTVDGEMAMGLYKKKWWNLESFCWSVEIEARHADSDSPRSFAHKDGGKGNEDFVIKAICVCCSPAGGLEGNCLHGGEHLAAFSKIVKQYTDIT